MTVGPVGVEPYLPDECRRALESWVCDDPASQDAAGHVERCPSCRELAAGIRLDQQLLRWQLGRIAPPPPRRLVLRAPLVAASGHPRRVSLAVLPFLIAVTLVLLLGVGYLLGRIGQGRRAPIERAEREAAAIQRLVDEHLAPPGAEGAVPPDDWPARLRAAAPTPLRSIAGGSLLLDPFGEPYRLDARSGSWRVRSTGPDRRDDRGAGDDIPSLPSPPPG